MYEIELRDDFRLRNYYQNTLLGMETPPWQVLKDN